MNKGAHLHGKVHRIKYSTEKVDPKKRVIHVRDSWLPSLPYWLAIVLLIIWMLLFGGHLLTGNMISEFYATGADVFIMVSVLVACIVYVLSNARKTIALHSAH